MLSNRTSDFFPIDLDIVIPSIANTPITIPIVFWKFFSSAVWFGVDRLLTARNRQAMKHTMKWFQPLLVVQFGMFVNSAGVCNVQQWVVYLRQFACFNFEVIVVSAISQCSPSNARIAKFQLLIYSQFLEFNDVRRVTAARECWRSPFCFHLKLVRVYVFITGVLARQVMTPLLVDSASTRSPGNFFCPQAPMP